MRGNRRISVIIPARNEALAIAQVVGEIPPWADEIIVADNGSRDATPERARAAGAKVVSEPRPGYGLACQRAMAALDSPHIVVFVDGDLSDYPAKMDRLVDPILNQEAELVIGSRVLGNRQPGALSPQQRWGNAMACFFIRLFWGAPFTDLGPFRAVAKAALDRLAMADPDYGWTVEMQIKAVRLGMACLEVPVDYRRSISPSRISGTLGGVSRAGAKILFTIFKYALLGR